MERFVDLYIVPELVEPETMAGDTVVVIDVLRATTTIAYALAAGARAVIPCLEIDDARQLAETMLRSQIVLGGERGGMPIDGFDLGNSPSDYTPERVARKTVLFTTTNGTRALHHARLAKEVFTASFANLSSVVNRLIGCDRVHIVCAGTEGEHSMDDTLVAGLIVDRLERADGLPRKYNIPATAARDTWRSAFALPISLGAEPLTPEMLAQPLRESRGGRGLVELGLDADIVDAARIDSLSILPQLDTSKMQLRAAGE